MGPFWSVISLAVFVITIGSVGTALWNQDAVDYLPYLTAGMLVWLFITTSVTEACTVFSANANFYRHSRFNFSLLVYTLVWRNFIVFLHHLRVYAAVAIALAPQVIAGTASHQCVGRVLVVPGLLLLVLNGVWVSLLLGMVCLRFRDLQQLVLNIMQIAMFITPIFWPVEQIKGTVRMVFVHFNPLYHCVEIVRAPLLGKGPTLGNYLAVTAIAMIGWTVTYLAFERFRKRIAYWS